MFGAGCSSPGSGSGEPCDLPVDCGPAGDAACVDGECLTYDESSGHGGAVVDLSFGRDLHSIAASGYVWFLLRETANGSLKSCRDFLDGSTTPRDLTVNPLQENPKYLVFHWDTGGTFFPNNLVQFIRPARGVIAVAEGFQFLHGEGDLTSIGCTDGIEIVKDQNAELVIPIDVPQWR